MCGCGPEGTSDNRGEGGSEVPFFCPGGKLEKKEAKKLSSTRQYLAKKRRKVRIEMQRGMTGLWEGHLLQVISCTETNRKALFSCCKA